MIEIEIARDDRDRDRDRDRDNMDMDADGDGDRDGDIRNCPIGPTSQENLNRHRYTQLWPQIPLITSHLPMVRSIQASTSPSLKWGSWKPQPRPHGPD